MSSTSDIVSRGFESPFALRALEDTDDHPPMNKGTRLNIAILDDYQNLALRMADWSAVASREIHVTNGGAVNG